MIPHVALCVHNRPFARMCYTAVWLDHGSEQHLLFDSCSSEMTALELPQLVEERKKKKLDPPLHADNRPHPTPCLSADLHCVKKKKKKKKKLFWTLRYDSGYQRKSSIALFKFLFFFKKLHTWIFISNNEMWSRIPKNGIVHQMTHFKCTSINITSAAVTLNLIGCLIIIV